VSQPARLATEYLPRLLAACSLAYIVLLVLHLVGRPIGTDDLWWHLKLGEFYLSDGPWLASDPLLHTAREGPPAPATWLFDVFVHLADRFVGLHGLRVVHVALVGAILLLAYSLFWREARSQLAACLAASVFAIVSWYRLFQFRPELLSILLAFVLYRLLFEAGGAPTWRRIAVATALLLLWANIHALYLIGPLLCLAALAGVGFRMLLARWGAGKGDARLSETARCGRPGGRLAAALVLGLLASSLNPGGASRHFSFWKSSAESQIWRIWDEWAPFDPFHWSEVGGHMGFLPWLLTNALVVGVVLAAVWGTRRFLRRPCAETLRGVDPMLLGLAASYLLAILVAIRFQWMAIFPLLFLLRSSRAALAGQPRMLVPARWTIAALCVALAVAFPRLGGYGAWASGLRRPETYFSRAFDVVKYPPDGVRFLMETGVEGNLFNSYFVGSFLGYWLAPGLRGFLNHTLNVPNVIIDEVQAIEDQRGLRPTESFLDILDRRSVDFFVGQGLPMTRWRYPHYTTAHLEGAPGWILVFRSLRTAIYMRDDPRNRANRERIERYYEREAVPFDSERGLDVAAVLRQRPDWAVAHGMAPQEYPRLIRARENVPPAVRLQILDRLGQSYAAIGAYAEQVELDRSLLALRPNTKSALRRLVYGLLRLDRPKDAQSAASRLLQLDPGDPRSRIFAVVAARYAELRLAQPELHPSQGLPRPPSSVTNGLPLFTTAEISGLNWYSAEGAALSAVRDASKPLPPR